jgi:hypothetical protein
MQQFKSTGQAQWFLSGHNQINNLLNLGREHATAAEHRASRVQKFRVSGEISKWRRGVPVDTSSGQSTVSSSSEWLRWKKSASLRHLIPARLKRWTPRAQRSGCGPDEKQLHVVVLRLLTALTTEPAVVKLCMMLG